MLGSVSIRNVFDALQSISGPERLPGLWVEQHITVLAAFGGDWFDAVAVGWFVGINRWDTSGRFGCLHKHAEPFFARENVIICVKDQQETTGHDKDQQNFVHGHVQQKHLEAA